MACSNTYIVYGSLLILYNWYTLFDSRRKDPEAFGLPPIPLGGLLLFLGLRDFATIDSYAWLAFFIDYGTIIVVVAIPYGIRAEWPTCRFNLLHRFIAEVEGHSDDIRLFKKGIATIRSNYEQPENFDGKAYCSGEILTGNWIQQANGFVLEGYAGDRVLHISKCDGGYKTVEQNYVANRNGKQDRRDGMELKKVR